MCNMLKIRYNEADFRFIMLYVLFTLLVVYTCGSVNCEGCMYNKYTTVLGLQYRQT